jgi:hypothetical protein
MTNLGLAPLHPTSTRPHDLRPGIWGAEMSDTFVAQSLAETRAKYDERRFEMTFVDASGKRQTISLPVSVAADLAPVLQSLSAGLGNTCIGFTKMPKSTAVGSARHERLILVRFDDDPPYALNLDEAENLWRGVREEAEEVSLMKTPARQ